MAGALLAAQAPAPAASAQGAAQGNSAQGNSAQGNPDEPTPFDAQTVRRAAQKLAKSPYRAPETKLPDAIANLSYDQYRAIRFDPGQSLWRGRNLPAEVQFFHRGFLFRSRVDISEVADGKATPIRYRPEQFDFGPTPRPGVPDLGYAGFRIHGALNRPDYLDEYAVFLGASYFRAVGRHQGYGLSARGLSLKTADQGGEEFPAFTAFWLERPQPNTNAIGVWALLDSPSAAAALRFTIRPGDNTVFDVELSLYPRVDIAQPGIATLTSMFYFDASDRRGIDDYRRAVHDSDGLLMLTGRGEELWRPLKNPTTLQISSFSDTSPRGFGLMQRKRSLDAFQDLEARYDRRPSAWVEPIGDWGEGVVQLVEIPTRNDTHDNIVAYWRPKQALKANGEYSFTYRLHWGLEAPVRNDLARIAATRGGLSPQPDTRLFVIDASGDKLKSLPTDAKLTLVASADHGKVLNQVAQPNPEQGGWRMSFELAPGDAKVVELRAQLMADDTPVSETWIYRWTA
jgi:glucans biosynthesis protein